MIGATVRTRNDYGLYLDFAICNRNNSKHVTVAMVILLKRNVKLLRMYGLIFDINNLDRKS